MKLIARTLSILAAALIVVGIAFTIGQSSGMPSSNTERQMPPEFAQTSSTSATGHQMLPMRGEHNESASLFGIVEIVKNLAIISIIVVAVSSISRRLQRRNPRVGGPRPHAPPA